MHISIDQTIDIYNELIESKNGKQGVVFAYELMPNPYKSRYEDDILTEKKVAEDLHSICYIFSKKHNVSIKINDVELSDWILKIRAEELRFKDNLIIKTTKNKDNNMIKNGKLLLIEKFDVRRQAYGIPATEWTIPDLMSKSYDLVKTSELVMAVDGSLNTVILKNRWGKDGIVLSREEYKDYLRLKEKEKHENDKLDNTSEKKSFLGRIFDRIKIYPFN
jgi:hypothetical protein